MRLNLFCSSTMVLQRVIIRYEFVVPKYSVKAWSYCERKSQNACTENNQDLWISSCFLINEFNNVAEKMVTVKLLSHPMYLGQRSWLASHIVGMDFPFWSYGFPMNGISRTGLYLTQFFKPQIVGFHHSTPKSRNFEKLPNCRPMSFSIAMTLC